MEFVQMGSDTYAGHHDHRNCGAVCQITVPEPRELPPGAVFRSKADGPVQELVQNNEFANSVLDLWTVYVSESKHQGVDYNADDFVLYTYLTLGIDIKEGTMPTNNTTQADITQEFTWRFVQLTDDETPTIDILESGESYFLIDPIALSQLIDTLQEARRALKGLLTGSECELLEAADPDEEGRKRLTVRQAYDLWNEYANRNA